MGSATQHLSQQPPCCLGEQLSCLWPQPSWQGRVQPAPCQTMGTDQNAGRSTKPPTRPPTRPSTNRNVAPPTPRSAPPPTRPLTRPSTRSSVAPATKKSAQATATTSSATVSPTNRATVCRFRSQCKNRCNRAMMCQSSNVTRCRCKCQIRSAWMCQGSGVRRCLSRDQFKFPSSPATRCPRRSVSKCPSRCQSRYPPRCPRRCARTVMDTDQEVALPALMELVGLSEALQGASLVDTLADLEAAMVVLDGGNSPWGFSTTTHRELLKKEQILHNLC